MTFQEANKQISLKDNIAPSFYDLHWSVVDEEYSQFWLSGGRGSTKSSFIAIEIIIGMMDDPESNAACFRKVSNTIRDSLYSTFEWAIGVLGVSDKWKGTVAPFEFVYLPTGQKIIMKGLDDPQKMKSLKVAKGYFKYLWFEELAEFSGMEEVRNVQQSVLRGGESFIEFLSYNPPRDPQAWVNEEKNAVNDNRFVHHSTYLDVPEKWLGRRFINDANRLKNHDDVLYQCEYMGISVGLTDSVVFNGKYVVQDFEPQEWWSCLYGADWGFANDPNVLVKVWIAPHDEYGSNCLYIEYEAYGYKVDNQDIPELYDKIPESRKYVIRADCSRPETISYVSQKGFNVVAADKWSGSVEDGISYIRSFDKIIIHPRCENMIEEARLYSYKIDKITKDIMPTLVKGYDHCFVGNTLISTINGDIPIKDINVGDMVLTRKGYKKVVEKFDNGIKPIKTYQLLNGKSLTCTDTHYIITPKDKVYIKDINKYHRLYYRSGKCGYIETENQKLQYITALNLDAIQIAKDALTGCITKSQRNTSISRYIRMKLDVFLMASIFITRIIIHLIILLITFVLWISQAIWQNIPAIIKNITKKLLSSIYLKLITYLKNGIGVMMGGLGTENIMRKINTFYTKRKPIVASNVIENMKVLKEFNLITFARINVNQSTGVIVALITLKESVNTARGHLYLINTQKYKHAQKDVQRVYDLHIEDNHEYFANGLLVSNCWDSVRYALSKLIKHRRSGFTKKQVKANIKRAKTTTAPREGSQSW